MKDIIHRPREIDIFADIVPDNLEIPVPGKMRDILLISGEEIIDREHPEPASEEPVAQMRSEEPPAARDDHCFFIHHLSLIARAFRLGFRPGFGFRGFADLFQLDEELGDRVLPGSKDHAKFPLGLFEVQ